MQNQDDLKAALALIFEGIDRLHNGFDKKRKFTIDGRLVGDVGEMIAELNYDIVLDETSLPGYDATASDGRRVQIKATFQDALTFKTVPDYYLGLKLYKNGDFEEIYNGPGSIIYDRFAHRKHIGTALLRFPNKELKALSTGIPPEHRISVRRPV